MAAQGEPGYLAAQSDPGSTSERSTDSPVPGSEDDLAGGPLPGPEWSEERFRVDRKKLEAMLQAAAEGKGKSGEDFFQKIMEETNTQIAWPSKLKIGAKSKKGIALNWRHRRSSSISEQSLLCHRQELRGQRRMRKISICSQDGIICWIYLEFFHSSFFFL